MEINEFKKIFDDVLRENKFSKNGNNYFKNENEVICIIGLQKSGYSDSYYINIGFVIKQIRPQLTHPKYNEADIRARFTTCNLTNASNSFELEFIDENAKDKLRACFKTNMQEYLAGGLTLISLKNLLTAKPVLLYQTLPDARRLLES